MRLVLGGIVLVVSEMAGVSTYIVLRNMAWAFDIALCVGYTVLVFGGLVTDRLSNSSKTLMPWVNLLLTHAIFLLVVVVTVGIVVYLKPPDQDWAPHQGAGINWYLLAVIAVPMLLAFVEKALLSRTKASAAE